MRETTKVLVNPFKKGEKVVVPAGATFTSTNPQMVGKQTSKRKVTNEVEVVFEPYAKARFIGSRGTSIVSVTPPRIYCAGTGGYWKEITVTEEMILLNGKTVEYKEVRIS